ncbi:unnamed protein product [Ascophyllum nodosum]
MFGVHVCSKPKPPEEKSSLVVCRGQMALPPEVTLNLLQVQFIHAYNNTASLARQMKASDPMSRETKILYQVPCGDDEFIRIVWGSFRAAGVAWARDFCFLQHGCTTTDPDSGERLFAVVAGSIERPEVPDMESLCKRIRSKVKTSGYVFREATDGTLRASYVVNVNPGGWIPSKIVNVICTNQAMNVSRLGTRLKTTAKALKALEMEPPIQSSSIAWRCIYEVPLSCPAAGASSPWTVSIKFWADNKVWFRVSVVSGGATTNWKPEGMASTVGEGQWELYQAGTAVRAGFTFKPVGAATSGEAKEGTENAGADEVALRQDAKACVLEFKSGGWTKGVSVFYAIDVTP